MITQTAQADTLFSEALTSSLGKFTSAGSASVASTGVTLRGSTTSSGRGVLTSSAISTKGYTAVTLSFNRVTYGLDAGETGIAEVSVNGGSFVAVESTTATTAATVTLPLGASAANQSSVVIRFRVNANSTLEYYRVKNVALTGASTSGGGGATGSMPGENIVCASSNQAAGNYTYTLNVEGRSRSYRLHIPSSLTTPAAVVISLHGLSSSASSQQNGSGWDTTCDSNKTFVVAYPDGIDNAWNVGPFNNTVDDVGFMSAIVNDISKRVRIAPNKIFISGTSLGGGFSHKMACKHADYFAGAAPVVFHLWTSPTDVANCAPAQPISVLEYAGRNDILVRYSGGTSSVNGESMTHLSATASFEKWASLNGCSGSPATVWSSGLSYTNKQYQSCSGGVIIGLASLNCGHGYCTDSSFGLPSDDAWKVFKTKTRPGRKADACQ